MKYRRKYTLYSVLNVKGKEVWYFRIYMPDGTRRAKSTGCTSKEKAMRYVDELLEDELLIRKVFKSDLVIAVDSTNSHIQSSIPSVPVSSMMFEEYASPWGHWETCPYILARTVGKEKQKLLTDEECVRLFDADRIKELWNDRIVYYVYSLIAGLTGLRAGELLAMTINEVFRNKIVVKRSYNESYGMTTTKTKEERVVPITDEIYRYLFVAWQSHPDEENDFIFSFDGEKPMYEGRARAAFYKAMEKSGISETERKERGITFHSWRYEFTTDCVKSNMHPKKIMVLTGHKSAEMLLRYTDLDAEKDLSDQILEI